MDVHRAGTDTSANSPELPTDLSGAYHPRLVGGELGLQAYTFEGINYDNLTLLYAVINSNNLSWPYIRDMLRSDG